MPDPKLPAAKRRLAALLRDEEYGPKLVRLNRTDERRVLDLIYDNRGREARQVLTDLDAGRRRHRTFRDKARDYRSLPPRTRRQTWSNIMEDVQDHEAEFWELYRRAA